MSLRLSIKRPLWADIPTLPEGCTSTTYPLDNPQYSVVRIRKHGDAVNATYTARDALSLIKAWEETGTDATIHAWSIIGIDTFLDTYTFAPDVVFPVSEASYLFMQSYDGSEFFQYYVVACRTESCWGG